MPTIWVLTPSLSELERNSYHIPRLSVFYLQLFGPLLEKLPISVQKVLKSPGLDGKVYVVNDIEKIGKKDRVLSISQYAKEAERRYLWSSNRFNALVELAENQNDARLIDFTEPCMGAKLHLLCIYLSIAKEPRLLTAMVQIE